MVSIWELAEVLCGFNVGRSGLDPPVDQKRNL
jgi:hypothetical protein